MASNNKFSRRPEHGGKIVKAWGRLWEVGKSANYITAESYMGKLRVCAFVTLPAYELNSSGTGYFWYPSDYDIDVISRLAHPTFLEGLKLNPATSLRRILPNGNTVKC